ncbi:MAG: DNA mismatch repair endonuclease MutL [Candidatus Desulfofervidaceae bacterium]|nr:DNA mismatch repair endonuclease MutL [Candidatus Desulfofervidaceae bacterium]
MGKIKILPQNLSNLIAAGEVVERPAAAVKELLENALDAQAKRIKIEIEKGGKELIKVEDDGTGILAEDLKLAVRRHATSKISQPADLFHISTLGFRGEALASIAAVSHLRLASRVQNQPWGKEIVVIGGEIEAEKDIGMPPGTTVEVRDLFFNTPARKKFLKKDATELGHIYETVVRLSLAHPEVFFSLMSNRRTLLSLSSVQELKERLGQIFGLEVTHKAKIVEAEAQNLKIKGVIAPLEFSRPSPRDMHFYVNRRWVRSPLLNQVVYKSLSDTWPKGRYPLLVVFISLPPEEVDVNIHPTKQEVRFKQPYYVQEALERVLRQALGKRLNTVISDFESDIPLETKSIPDSLPQKPVSTASLDSSFVFTAQEPAPSYGISLSQKASFPKTFHILGQLWGTYIVCSTQEELILIDQHAAHERLNYERLKRLYNSAPRQGQELLTPILLETNPIETGILEEILPDLEKLGFQLEPFGEKAFLVRAVPSLLIHQDVRSLLEKILADLRLLPKAPTLAEMTESLLKTMACHLSVRAHDTLSREEMEHLLAELEALDILHCPHGRPFYKVISKEEIAKFFHRS